MDSSKASMAEPNRFSRRAAFALLLVALLTLSSGVAVAQTPVEVRVAPGSSLVVVGESVDVAVEVVDVDSLYGVDVKLEFDPAVVQVVDMDPILPGVQVSLGLFLDPGFVIVNDANNETGVLRFAMTQLSPSEAKSGTGVLIVVKLDGMTVSTPSPLSMAHAQLAGPGGVSIPAEPVSGEIEVVESSTEPTGTPIPTQAPGTPMPTFTPMDTPGPATLTATASMPTATPTPEATEETPEPTSSPAATEAPPTPPAQTPVATSAPTDAAASPTTQLLTPTSTVVPETTASEQASPLPSETTAPATLTSPPPAATQPGETVVVQVPARDTQEPSQGAGGSTSPDMAQLFLWIALGALGLAILAAVAALIVWLVRRQTPAE